uniref:(northern house mosquito) hypothetical protein n=1 Tax=Culex pipiens TaxID=7175 RepID=A0A8D8A938_CULPI
MLTLFFLTRSFFLLLVCQTTSKHLMVNFNFFNFAFLLFSSVFLDYSDTHIFITIISNSRFSSFFKIMIHHVVYHFYILNCLVEFCMLPPLLLIVSLECVFLFVWNFHALLANWY